MPELRFSGRKFFFIFLISFIFLLSSLPLSFAWSDDYTSWQFRRPIIINNTANSNNLTDYQLFINVTYDSDMQNDFSDIRFTWYNASSGEEQPIPYVANISNAPEPDEGLACVSGSYCEFYVRVPEILANTYYDESNTTVFMYYYNPDVNSTANFSATYYGADGEFNSDNGWTYELSGATNTQFSITNGHLEAQMDDDDRCYVYVNSTVEFQDFVIEALYTGLIGGSGTYGYSHSGVSDTVDVPNRKCSTNTQNAITAEISHYDSFIRNAWVMGGTDNSDSKIETGISGTRALKIVRQGSTTTWYLYPTWQDLRQGTNLINSVSATTNNTVMDVIIPASSSYCSCDGYHDIVSWNVERFRVRKYADPEPAIELGNKEANKLKLQIIEPDDGYNSVGNYVNFTAYIEGENPLANLTLNIDSYTYQNSTDLINASNYTFENIWLPISDYIWNMTLCDNETCLTSSNRQLTISGVNLTIYIKDENTKELITNETVYLTIYNSSGSVVDTLNTTTGSVGITLISPLNYIVSAYTNESYTNLRRMSYLTTADAETQTATIYLLQDGLGSINYFIVRDNNGFPINGAWVKITHNNEIIDYAITDNEGRLASYLDPYKLYKIYAGYGNAQTETEFYGSAIVTHTIYLTLEVTVPEAIEVWFTPQGEVRENETAFLRIHIRNWRQVDNVTVFVFDDMAWLGVYENVGETYAPHSYVYHFDLDNQDYSWCNSTIDCYGDLNEVTWRITDTPINDIGTTGKVLIKAYVYDVNGTLHEYGQYGIVTKVRKFLSDFLMLLSSEQRHLIGLFLVMIVTSLVAYNFNLTFTQAGYIAMVMMCFCTYIGLFDKKMIYLPILAFISLIFWREVKG